MPLSLTSVLDSPVTASIKGFPGGTPPISLAEVGKQGWNVLAEDLPLPLLVLKQSALEHNLATVQRWCERRGALLAPHGKTTMAPQLFQAQLEAGAWGITAATVEQVQVYRAVGVSRVVLANQVVGAPALRYLAAERARDTAFELYSWVDSAASVQALADAYGRYRPGRPWQVLLEIGWPGGRTGARDETAIQQVLDAVAASDGAVGLAGVAVFEGLLAVASVSASAAGGVATGVDLDSFLTRVVETAERLHTQGVLPDGYLLSGGGSSSFDAVCTHFSRAAGARVLLRAGCYVTHDHGMNDATSPLGSADPRIGDGDEPLRPALELWTYVHSAPEEGLAFLTLGRRDAPYDAGLPTPLAFIPAGSAERRPLEQATVSGLNDQHCYLRHHGEVKVGDRVILGISHPCTAFDKWQVIPVVDDGYRVVDAIRTYF